MPYMIFMTRNYSDSCAAQGCMTGLIGQVSERQSTCRISVNGGDDLAGALCSGICSYWGRKKEI